MDSSNQKKDNEDQNDKLNSIMNDYYRLIKESSDLSINERKYLADLLHNGELSKFREYYWQYLRETKKSYPGDEEIETNIKQRDESLKEQNEFKRLLKSYSSRLTELEEANSILHLKNENLESLNFEKETLLEQAVSRIKLLETSNNELQSRVQQERIDEKIPGYVESVKNELSSDDKYFIVMSQVWAVVGCVFGLLSVCASFYTLFATLDFNSLKGFELFYFFTRGLIGISILSWLAYICLGNSKKYTHESILRKDRRHALMFGQVFLQIYGSTSTKEDAVLVFKDWNMSGNSAFSDKTELPPGFQSLWDSAKEKLKSSTSDKAVN